MLTQADEVVITAVPDLANLRNAKNIVDMLKKIRPNDTPPQLILNQVGMPKRPEIIAGRFLPIRSAIDADRHHPVRCRCCSAMPPITAG